MYINRANIPNATMLAIMPYCGLNEATITLSNVTNTATKRITNSWVYFMSNSRHQKIITNLVVIGNESVVGYIHDGNSIGIESI